MIVSTERSIEPRCTGMCGALATSRPSRVEHRAGEVEPLLDVDRIGGVLQRHAHLLGDRHEEVVEDLQHHRIGLRRRSPRAAAPACTRVSTTWFFGVISARQPSSTTIVWCGSMTAPGRRRARRAAAPRAGRRRPRATRRCEKKRVRARGRRARRVRLDGARALGETRRAADRLDVDRLDRPAPWSRSMKPKRALCAASKARRIAAASASSTSSAVSEPA